MMKMIGFLTRLWLRNEKKTASLVFHYMVPMIDYANKGR